MTSASIVAISAPVFISTIIKPIIEKILSGAASVGKDVIFKRQKSLENYIVETREKHRYFSSVVFSNEGKLLEDYCIPLTLEKDDSRGNRALVVVDSIPRDLLSTYNKILIVDTAGMGKSTLLKFIFLKQIEKEDKIPIFIELRKLSKEISIENFILEEVFQDNSPEAKKFLSTCLAEGIFSFYLDGFDEISDENKPHVSSGIIKLTRVSKKSAFILSSRQEKSLSSLSSFHRFRIKPLSKTEAFSLIRKITPIAERAATLIEKLGEDSARNLDEFLKNPLLVSLLVRSYIHTPILPVRLSEFYRQVFDALYQNHDAQKELGGFSRKKSSGLDLDRFHKALRALGFLTYKNSKLEFSSDELLYEIENAKRITLDTQYAASALQDDLLRAVPLFVQEGTKIRWAHRSLQEYFAAAYICMDSKGNQENILLKIYKKSFSRNFNLLRMCADIDDKTFKQSIVREFLESKLTEIENSYQVRDFKNLSDAILEARRIINISEMGYICRFEENTSMNAAHLELPDEVTSLMDTDKIGGYWIVDEFFDPSIEENAKEVSYAVFSTDSETNLLIRMIESYCGTKITNNKKPEPIKINIAGMEPKKLYEINSLPDNILNSDENFNLLTLGLSQIWTMRYEKNEMRRLLSEINEAKNCSDHLNFDFD
jgi:hypothetical protein